MAEQTCLYYNSTFGVDVVLLRFATTFGPGKTERHGMMGVTSQIIEAPAKGLPFHHKQGGDEKDDFVYNKDSLSASTWLRLRASSSIAFSTSARASGRRSTTSPPSCAGKYPAPTSRSVPA